MEYTPAEIMADKAGKEFAAYLNATADVREMRLRMFDPIPRGDYMALAIAFKEVTPDMLQAYRDGFNAEIFDDNKKDTK